MAFLKFNKSQLVNLSYSLKREIICANKTGAYCNTSIVTCNTRRYHGLLAVPVDCFGGEKHLLLSSLDESLIMNGKQFNLGIHCYGDIYEPRGHKYIVDFNADPIPSITYKVGEIVFRKSILLVPDNDQVMIRFELLEAPAKVTLQLKPFLAFRNIHALTSQNPDARTAGRKIKGGMAWNLYEGFPDLNLQFNSKDVVFHPSGFWYNGITYSDEYRRGFDCKEDLFVPGCFETVMKAGDSIVFSASVNEVETSSLKRKFTSYVNAIGPITSVHSWSAGPTCSSRRGAAANRSRPDSPGSTRDSSGRPFTAFPPLPFWPTVPSRTSRKSLTTSFPTRRRGCITGLHRWRPRSVLPECYSSTLNTAPIRAMCGRNTAMSRRR